MMIRRVAFLIVIFLFLTPVCPSFGYEPTIEELYVIRQQLAHFCDRADNGKRYDVCVSFNKVRKKLPATITEVEILRKLYDQSMR